MTDSQFPINHGAVVTVSCEKGYRHQGDQILECNKNQDFSFNTRPGCLQSKLFPCKLYQKEIEFQLREHLNLKYFRGKIKVQKHWKRGYWLGGRPSAAVPRESARTRADSARFGADPANFRQNYFPADSAERPANVRRTPADSARIRADPRGVRRELAEEFTRKMSANKNLYYTSAPRGRASAADDRPPRKY